MDFEEWIEDQGFIRIADDTYECPGLHVWHIDEMRNEYESQPIPEKG